MSKRPEQADGGAELVGAYRAGDLTRRAFSEQAGIAVSTLDYYLRRENERFKKKQRLLPVVVTVKPEEGKTPDIAVVASNGRRVEVRRGFDPELLLRVISVLERAYRCLGWGRQQRSLWESSQPICARASKDSTAWFATRWERIH